MLYNIITKTVSDKRKGMPKKEDKEKSTEIWPAGVEPAILGLYGWSVEQLQSSTLPTDLVGSCSVAAYSHYNPMLHQTCLILFWQSKYEIR